MPRPLPPSHGADPHTHMLRAAPSSDPRNHSSWEWEMTSDSIWYWSPLYLLYQVGGSLDPQGQPSPSTGSLCRQQKLFHLRTFSFFWAEVCLICILHLLAFSQQQNEASLFCCRSRWCPELCLLPPSFYISNHLRGSTVFIFYRTDCMASLLNTCFLLGPYLMWPLPIPVSLG